jgi:hypothetical protein
LTRHRRGRPLLAAFDREIIVWKKIVLAASSAAMVLGAGTAALAVSGANSPSAPAPQSAAAGASGANAAGGAAKAARPGMRALKRALHAQWVTRDRHNANAFVTHDAIRGAVTAVSATSITVKAADGVSQTYAVTGTTKVHLRTAAASGTRGGAAGTIGDVHAGDKVAVVGTGTTSLTAGHIVDGTK